MKTRENRIAFDDSMFEGFGHAGYKYVCRQEDKGRNLQTVSPCDRHQEVEQEARDQHGAAQRLQTFQHVQERKRHRSPIPLRLEFQVWQSRPWPPFMFKPIITHRLANGTEVNKYKGRRDGALCRNPGTDRGNHPTKVLLEPEQDRDSVSQSKATSRQKSRVLAPDYPRRQSQR